MDYDQLRYEVDDPVATITLDRPDQLNAWTGRMNHEFADAIGRAAADPAVVGIIVTGAGRGFCAGADLNLLTDLSTDAGSAADGAGHAGDEDPASGLLGGGDRPGDPDAGADLRGTYTYLLSVPKPVIAAINGAVAGMGVPIVLACDLRLMNRDAVLTTSFAQRGLIAEWGIAWQLTRLVGPAHALDLLFSARKVGGDEAECIGLVNRSLPADEVVPAARAYLVDLAEHCSPTSMAVIKRQVYLDLHRGLGLAGSEAERLMAESFARPDFAEGVQSYLQRRPPAFGRLGDQPVRY